MPLSSVKSWFHKYILKPPFLITLMMIVWAAEILIHDIPLKEVVGCKGDSHQFCLLQAEEIKWPLPLFVKVAVESIHHLGHSLII